MKEPTRTIIAQELIRAGFLALLLVPVWGILVVRQSVAPTGWSFLAVVAGVSALAFALLVALRALTGWRLLAPWPGSLPRWERNLTAALLWVLVSLLAISVVAEQPYLGLAVALLGGAVLGIVLVRNYEAGQQK